MPTNVKGSLEAAKSVVEALALFSTVIYAPTLDIDELEKTQGFPACVLNNEGGRREKYSGKKWDMRMSVTVCVNHPSGGDMEEAEGRCLDLIEALEDALQNDKTIGLMMVEDGSTQGVAAASGSSYVYQSAVWAYRIRRG